MKNQQTRFASMLALGATILLISIVIGTRLGDHVIGSGDGRTNSVAVDLPTPVPVSSSTVPPSSTKWKKSHVVAVATDPAFPDPRLTPTPEPSPTPQPSASPQAKARQTNAHASTPNLVGFPRPDASPDPYVDSAPQPTDEPQKKPKTSDELGE